MKAQLKDKWHIKGEICGNGFNPSIPFGLGATCVALTDLVGRHKNFQSYFLSVTVTADIGQCRKEENFHEASDF